ncbi:hypothetical protein BASA81_006516 [Batrachochytrium salamandrivorans]|nr:hypothetical protein BASA81_006516 [Batrachochytrium salamandrivorans]
MSILYWLGLAVVGTMAEDVYREYGDDEGRDYDHGDYSGNGNGGRNGYVDDDYDDYQIILLFKAVIFGAAMVMSLLALVGCCYARQRPGEMDVPVEDFNCFCCGTSSLAKIRRLCIAVGFFSFALVSFAWPLPVMILSNLICFVGIWLSVNLYRASTQSSFVHSRWVLCAPRYHKILLFCGIVELMHLVVGMLLAFYFRPPICTMYFYMPRPNDCELANILSLQALGLLAGLMIGLGITLGDVSVRLQQAANAHVQSPDQSFYHVAPMATADHPLVIPVNPNQGLLGPKPPTSV